MGHRGGQVVQVRTPIRAVLDATTVYGRVDDQVIEAIISGDVLAVIDDERIRTVVGDPLPFPPTENALALWDGYDLPSVGSTATTWADVTGGYTLEEGGDAAPMVVASPERRALELQFGASVNNGRSLGLPIGESVIPTGGDWTVYLRVQVRDATPAANRVILTQYALGHSDRGSIMVTSAGLAGVWNSANGFTFGPAWTEGTWQTLVVTQTGTTCTVRLDGVDGTPASLVYNFPVVANTRFRIGGVDTDAGAPGYLVQLQADCDVACCYIYGVAHDAAMVAAVENIIAARHG